MVFSSVTFLLYFLPIVLLLLWLLPIHYRNTVLLISSLIFYGWEEPRFIWVMFLSIIVDFTCGLMIERMQGANQRGLMRVWLAVSLSINLGLLIYFKYASFLMHSLAQIMKTQITIRNIALPMGISFYTFQTMSYSIDVYRGQVRAERNILRFATYVTLFPQLIAGPIVRYETIAHELKNPKQSAQGFWSGWRRFLVGLSKKVLLANTMGLIWNRTQSTIYPPSLLLSWMGIVAFGFQIYFDFSGYSDMAIGLGSLFGFTFLENFNYPYISSSVTEFWRRWHISLSTWFKEYVYIPLGGNRQGIVRSIVNLLIVWMLTGFWHGASWNFLIWGLYFALLLIIEKYILGKYLKKLPKVIQHGYTLFFIAISWAIFALESPAEIINALKIMLGFADVPIINDATRYLFHNYKIMFFIACIASTPWPRNVYRKLCMNHPEHIKLEGMAMIIMFIVSVMYLVTQSYNPFIYFRF